MANLNRDYLVTLDVKTSDITLSSPMTFYVTDRRTMNIFVKLVMNMSDNPVIKDYVALENAIGYRTELVLVAPNNQPFYLEGELLNGDEALFCFNLDTEQISKIGDWVCELRVYSVVEEEEEIVTSKSFLYSVNKSITTSLDDVVLDDTTYGIIDELIGRIEALEDASPGGENDTRLTVLEATKYDDVQVQKTQGKITLTFYAKKMKMKTVEIPASEGLEQRVADCEESIAWLLENGGGGGGVVSAYLSTTDSENFILTGGTDLELHLDFYSPNIGKGTLKVTIDDVDVMSSTLSQGESTVVITGDLLHKGVNVVKVYAVDRVGVMTNALVFNVRYGSTELTTTFDPYQIYEVGAVVRYYFTAVALNTADKLKFYMSIDGQTQAPVDCTSDVRAYFTFPILSIGSHYCEAWVEDSYGKSNTIAFNFVVLDDSSLAINSTTRTTNVEEGAQLILDYRVYMKNNNKFITETYIDNELINTGECNADTNYYTNSSLKEGQHTIKIVAYNIDKTTSDYVSWVVNITPSTYEMRQPITTGAIAMFTAKDRTNSDQNRGTWTGKDQDGNPVFANLRGFSYDTDNGWNNNELIISGKSTVEIPIAPLANNARYGFTLDIEFTSKQIGAEDAEVLSLWNETDNCGIRITTERLILRSKAGNECNLFFSDNENVSAMFIIDRDEKVAKIYLNGVMCEAFSLSDYVAGGQTVLEDFTVDSNIILGGGADKNGYCKIKNLRVYEVALATNEILNNWLSNITDKTAQRDMEKFQNGDDLPTLTIYCDFAGLGKDDKKPCDIIYYSPNVTKYGESFTLSGKTSQLQYQGTSSMQYPIKNYRLNLRDVSGEKWYYNPYDGGQGECRFTLKADFMSSGHWQNTGLAKFVSDKLYGYKTNDLSTMNPAKRYDIQNGGTLKDTRDSINGFPCRLILVNDGSTPLNEGQQEPTPGNTKDMGIFNFNNDKDNVTSLGLDTDIFPNALSYEVTANSDTSAGAFVPYSEQGDWYADYKLNSGNGRKNSPLFPCTPSSTLKVTFYDSNDNILTDNSLFFVYTSDKTYNGQYWSTFNTTYNCNTYSLAKEAHYVQFLVNDIHKFLYDGVMYFVGNESSSPALYRKSDITELEYLQQSFELRYPDEDDVGKDYGYLGMEAYEQECYMLDYWEIYGKYATTKIDVDIIGTTFTIEGANVEKAICAKDTTWLGDLNGTGEKTVLPGTNYVNFLTTSLDSFYVNGKKCVFRNVVAKDTVANPIIGIEPSDTPTFSTNYGLKRVIDWVGNCTDEEFVADYEKYFDKHYLLRYYLLVITLGMVDNLGKNMMLDTWDGQIWYPRFYDMDTICSYDNSGAIKFDVDIEMEQGYWNTSASRLWTKVRDLLHDELVVAYKDMRASGLSYDGLMNYFYGEQIAKIPQKYYNMDADVKYLPYADEYLGKAHGNGYEHLKRWLKNRLIFVDTLFDYGPSYESDMLTIRANTLDPITFEIETYTPVYQHVSYYNGQMSKLKIDGKTATTFTGNAQTATDQEILIYGGSNIKRIRGISSANPDSMLIGNATKLAELDISNCPILVDVNSNKANFAPHQYLNKLNIENCPQLGGTLELTYSPLIQEIKAKGTAVNGLRLPTSVKNLETLELPNTISSLALHDATSLETLEFDEGVAMQSIELSNCTGITNTENFDLTKTPTVILDNSYNTDELYMSETTNLTLRNMSNLERVIYTPNSEYSEFDINNVINGKNYKITANACPKLTTFMTTAPFRYSYKKEAYKEIIPEVYDYVVKDYKPGGTKFVYEVSGADCIKIKIDLSTCKEDGEGIISIGTAIEDWVGVHYHFYFSPSTKYFRGYLTCNGENMSSDKGIDITPYELGIVDIMLDSEGLWFNGELIPNTTTIKQFPTLQIGCNEDDPTTKVSNATYLYIAKYTPHKITFDDVTPNTAFTANTLDLADTQFQNVKFLCTTDVYNLKVPTTMKNFYCDSAMDIDTDVIEDGSYEVIHEELIEPYTTNYEENVVLKEIKEWIGYDTKPNWIIGKRGTENNGAPVQDFGDINCTELISVVGGTTLKPYSIPDTNDITLSPYYCLLEYDKDYNYIKTQNLIYNNARTLSDNTAYVRINMPNNTTGLTLDFTGTVPRTPNIIPSSANGSLIFNMYSNNTTQPTSTSPYMWDLTGLKLEDFYTYGMNNCINYVMGSSEELKVSQTTTLNNVTFDKYGITVRINASNSTETSSKHIITVGTEDVSVWGNSGKKIHVYLNPVTAQVKAQAVDCNASTTCYTTVQDLSNIIVTIHKDVVYVNGVDITGGFDYDSDDYYQVKNAFMKLDKINVYAPYAEGISSVICMGEEVIKSITMPQRMTGYSVRLVNANITPNEYPTMLYPKWIDTGLPITGKLDYTAYNGTSLAWAYAYTTGDVEIKPLDSRSIGQIECDYNKLYGTDFVDVVDIWVYKDTDVSKLSTNETITEAYIELTNDNYTTRIDEVLQWYPNCTDLYLFDDGSVTTLADMSDRNSVYYRTQIKKVTFVDGYFNNLLKLDKAFRLGIIEEIYNIPNSVTSLLYCFYDCTKLAHISNFPTALENMESMCFNCKSLETIPQIPNGVINVRTAFMDCQKLNCEINLSEATSINKGGLSCTFSGCYALTHIPIFPSNYTGSLQQTFYNCTSLTMPPVIPQGVTNMQITFQGCKSLTAAPAIPQGVTDMNSCFRGCTSLTTAPNIPNSVTNMASCFRETGLIHGPLLTNPNAQIGYAYMNCKSLKSAYIPLQGPYSAGYMDSTMGCEVLETIKFVGEWNRTANWWNIVHTTIPLTTQQSALHDFFANHLATVESATLTLGETYLSYLTEEEIAGAVAKGWTLQ